MMFAVGRLNRMRSKIVVAGRLRGSEAGSPAAAGGPPAPPRDPPAAPHEVVRDGGGTPGADRVPGGGDAVSQGTGTLSAHERSRRVH